MLVATKSQDSVALLRHRNVTTIAPSKQAPNDRETRQQHGRSIYRYSAPKNSGNWFRHRNLTQMMAVACDDNWR